MRVDNYVHIRHIILYHFEKDHTGGEAFRDLSELFGDGTIGETQVRRWFNRFKSGNTSLEDEKGREVVYPGVMKELFCKRWKKTKV